MAGLDARRVGVLGHGDDASKATVEALLGIDAHVVRSIARLRRPFAGDREQPLLDQYVDRTRIDAGSEGVDFQGFGPGADVQGRKGSVPCGRPDARRAAAAAEQFVDSVLQLREIGEQVAGWLRH
jgi:hypothetical protein